MKMVKMVKFYNKLNVPKILDLKSSSEQIFSRKLSLGAPVLRTEHYVSNLIPFNKMRAQSLDT